MSLYGLLAANGPSGFGYGSTAEQVTEGLSLVGKTVLVTGANAGLGAEVLRVLALRGARVLGTARTLEKAQVACAGAASALALSCELSDSASVRGCIAAVKASAARLDAIICNAGVMALPRLELAHGFEKQFLTNHIGHFMLVTGLVDQLSDTGRVVMLSSSAHRAAPKVGIEFDNLDGARGYGAWTAYGQSKLEVYAATHPSLATVSGEFLANCNIAKPRADANDPQLARRLWDVSEKIVAELG